MRDLIDALRDLDGTDIVLAVAHVICVGVIVLATVAWVAP